jgi:hypothetical protein
MFAPELLHDTLPAPALGKSPVTADQPKTLIFTTRRSRLVKSTS